MSYQDMPAWLGFVVFAAAAAGAFVWLRVLHGACQSFHRSFNVQMKQRLDDLFVFVDPNRLFVANLLLVLLLALFAWLLAGHFGAVLLVLGLAGWLPTLAMRRFERRHQSQIERQLPDTLMQLAATLRAGMSIPSAIDHVALRTAAPLGEELRMLSRERRLGIGLEDSLVRLRDRMPVETVQLFVCLLTVSQHSGGGLAQSLTVLATSSRRQLLLRNKLWALTAQGRLQAHVMSAVPLLVTAALFLIEPEVMRQLWTTSTGQVVTFTVLVLLAAGFWLVRRISKGIE